MKINVDKEKVGRLLKDGCSLVVFALMMTLPHITEKNVSTMKRYIGKANYSDAVSAIMASDMFGSYKNEIIELLKKGEDTEYYSSVIQVVNSDMFGSYKVDAIKKINEQL